MISLAFDDPLVWVLIIAAVIFLFGSSKIPQFAKALGQARKEFDNGWKGIASSVSNPPSTTAATLTPNAARSMGTSSGQVTPAVSGTLTDPVITAARNEGIDTRGKTRKQLAEELAWKISKKQPNRI